MTVRLLFLLSLAAAAADPIWIEGESPVESKVTRHPWYHGEVKAGLLSGGGFLSHFDEAFPGTAVYQVEVKEAGEYQLWLRANPVQSRLMLQLDGGPYSPVDLTQRQTGHTNIARDDKPDLRFLAWASAGKFKLAAGKHRIAFRFDSANANHGALDCFVLAAGDFEPSGILKPAELAARREQLAAENAGWTPWLPARDRFEPAAIDLRHLNERMAGEKGGIAAKDGGFIHRTTGEPVRLWGVNGPPHELKGEELAACARMLAKRGVNLVRLHGAVFDEKTGALDPARVAHVHEVVAAMKKEGIHSLLSVYFPLWLKPAPGPGWREGYDGRSHPFALLFFEPAFQQLHRGWLEALLAKPGPQGVVLAKEPAVMGVELVNEDSFFFWTFDEKTLPAPQLRKLEALFHRWAVKKHGTAEKALAAWENLRHPRDGDGRLGFRPLYQIFTDRTPRDRDTAAFLMETQRGFNESTRTWLRGLGYQGLVTASNWTTANNDILGPLEKYSYTAGDFIDRHGYFGCRHRGEHAAWSIREGHTYRDRSALRFEPESPGAPPDFSHPAVDVQFNGMPSMISETAWTRPNRYRGEAPLFYAVYGALQGSDAVVHFALDSAGWAVKPGFFMQPWTLMTPTQAGQFPAAALIFRQGRIREGEVLADFSLTLADALDLKGSPLVPPANLDELRKADAGDAPVPAARAREVDPLIHYAGRTSLRIGTDGATRGADLSRLIDRRAKRVTSSTGELVLDYGKGLLTLRAPSAQGALGDLKSGGTLALPDLEIVSPLELGQIVVVSLDGLPLASSRRMLLQVMTEEKASGFTTAPAAAGERRITALGSDPWLFRAPAGEVRFKRADAATLKVTALDLNGLPGESATGAVRVTLRPETVYYLIGD